MYVYMNVSVYVCTHVCVYVCMYLRMRMHTCLKYIDNNQSGLRFLPLLCGVVVVTDHKAQGKYIDRVGNCLDKRHPTTPVQGGSRMTGYTVQLGPADQSGSSFHQ